MMKKLLLTDYFGQIYAPEKLREVELLGKIKNANLNDLTIDQKLIKLNLKSNQPLLLENNPLNINYHHSII